MNTQDIFHYRQVNDHLITGGQPTEAQLRAAAAEGVQVVINLATYHPDHSLPDEAGLVRSLGLDYHFIPVVWDKPTADDFETFARCLQQQTGKRVLLHCAANYRVTAFVALFALQRWGWTEEQADAYLAWIWRPGEYPVWDDFIRQMKANIRAHGATHRLLD